MTRKHIHTWKITHVRIVKMCVVSCVRKCECGVMQESAQVYEIETYPTPYRAYADVIWELIWPPEFQKQVKNIYLGWRENEKYL